MDEIFIKPIATVKSDFKEKFGIPRQSGRANSLTSKIVFKKEFSDPDAFRALDGFSYVWIIFGFNKAFGKDWSPTVRPPRLGGNQKIGVFASRSPFRPNRLGLSSCKLIGIEKTENGIILNVLGLDLLDGTPVYDVKPYLPFTDAHLDAVGGYADKTVDYKLSVNFPEQLLSIIPEDKRDGLIECLSDDPRPSYQDDGREYGMAFSDFNVKFTVSDKVLTVIAVEKL